MPFQIENKFGNYRCDWCGRIINSNPIVVKTCCNNKPWTFCSSQCYNQWVREWLKRQEQKSGIKRNRLL